MATVESVSYVGDEESAMPLSTDLKTKQQKKEDGRRRAMQISMERLQISNNLNDDANAGGKSGKRGNRKSARHGARNQHRHKHFARWVLERFPHVLEDCSDAGKTSKSDASNYSKPTQRHILDVAGGKGELSARLSLCHSLNVVMIDPRPADVASVYVRSVVPKLPKKWQSSIHERLEQSPSFVQDELDKRFAQLVMPFVSPCNPEMPFMAPCKPEMPLDSLKSCYQDENLDAAVRNASLLIGLHSDGATEAIVDAALLYGKPFVVVPCCVFPNLFRERYISIPINDVSHDEIMNHRDSAGDKISKIPPVERNTRKEKQIPVRTHDQFCKYLQAKDPRFVMEILPFEGRNTAIWWSGK